MYWKDEFDKYDLIEETDSTVKITEPGYGQDSGQPGMIHPMSGLGQVLRRSGMDMIDMFRGDKIDPGFSSQDPYPDMDRGFYANPPENPFEKLMKGGQAIGELFQGSQYPQYEFDLPDGTGYSFDPNNPMNLYPDNPDSPYYDPGPVDDIPESDYEYWDSLA